MYYLKRNQIVFFLLTVTLMLSSIASYAAVQDTISTVDINFTPANITTLPNHTTRTATNVNRLEKLQKANVKSMPVKPEQNVKNRTLSTIFIAGFLGGLAALLMPCIFPMLPLTVSYFTKEAHSKAKAIRTAIFYGGSIIIIYVVFGLVITISFGADALNSLSTNGVFNFMFFVLLVAFAASFLGAFELTLPNSWVNQMDEKSEKSGLAGKYGAVDHIVPGSFEQVIVLSVVKLKHHN